MALIGVHFFVWVPSWFTSWSFFWPTSLVGTLGGTAGGFAFMNISDKVLNAYFFPFPILNRGGFLVPDYVVHRLNPVPYDKFHLWKTSVAC